jgi:hypothetical protein
MQIPHSFRTHVKNCKAREGDSRDWILIDKLARQLLAACGGPKQSGRILITPDPTNGYPFVASPASGLPAFPPEPPKPYTPPPPKPPRELGDVVRELVGLLGDGIKHVHISKEKRGIYYHVNYLSVQNKVVR